MDVQMIIGFLLGAIASAAPLIAAALGGMFSEKSGIVNIGLEGIMTFAAFMSATFIVFIEQTTYTIGIIPLFFGLLGGILGGLLFAYLHAFLTIKYKVDQTISGTIINILGFALALSLTSALNSGAATTAYKSSFPIKIFNIQLIVLIILLLVPIINYIMNNTKWGLRVKACGENPLAAQSTGINVNKIRTQAVLLSGVMGGIAGYALVVLFAGNFSSSTIAGKGFIALAILIFGQWKPIGILFAGLLFGFLDSLGTNASRIFSGENSPSLITLCILILLIIISFKFINNIVYKILASIVLYILILQVIFINTVIPEVYFSILPYIITIIALSFYSKSSSAPNALGKEF